MTEEVVPKVGEFWIDPSNGRVFEIQSARERHIDYVDFNGLEYTWLRRTFGDSARLATADEVIDSYIKSLPDAQMARIRVERHDDVTRVFVDDELIIVARIASGDGGQFLISTIKQAMGVMAYSHYLKSRIPITAREKKLADQYIETNGEIVTAVASHYPAPGQLYKHYKGGVYEIVAVGVHHDTREPMVVYRSLSQGHINIRPLNGNPHDPDGWLTPIDGGGFRFVKVKSDAG
jgi:hypothetical protein